MAKNKNGVKATVAHLVLDMTGSMESIRDVTIEATNEYLKGLKASSDVNFSFTLARFNSEIGLDAMVSGVPMKDVPELTGENYQPAAITPLYDAIGRTVFNAEKEAKKGQPVLIVIQTDGYENASTEYTHEGIKTLIEEKSKKGWQFVFLGCGIDAMAIGVGMGISAGSTMTYDAATVGAGMSAVSHSTVAYAASGSSRSSQFMRGRTDVRPTQKSLIQPLKKDKTTKPKTSSTIW